MAVEGAPAGLLQDWFSPGSGANKEIGILLVHGFTGSPASMRPWPNISISAATPSRFHFFPATVQLLKI